MTEIDYLRDYAVLDGERLESLWGEIDRLRGENHHLRKSVSGRPSSELHEAALAEKDTEIELLQGEIAEMANIREELGEKINSELAAENESLRFKIQILEAENVMLSLGDTKAAEIERLRAERETTRLFRRS